MWFPLFNLRLDLTYAVALDREMSLDTAKAARGCFDHLLCRMSPDTFSALYLYSYPQENASVVSLLYEKRKGVGWAWFQFHHMSETVTLPYIARMRRRVWPADWYSRRTGTIPLRIGEEKRALECDSFHPRELRLWLSGTNWPEGDPVHVHPPAGRMSAG